MNVRDQVGPGRDLNIFYLLDSLSCRFCRWACKEVLVGLLITHISLETATTDFLDFSIALSPNGDSDFACPYWVLKDHRKHQKKFILAIMEDLFIYLLKCCLCIASSYEHDEVLKLSRFGIEILLPNNSRFHSYLLKLCFPLGLWGYFESFNSSKYVGKWDLVCYVVRSCGYAKPQSYVWRISKSFIGERWYLPNGMSIRLSSFLTHLLPSSLAFISL